MKRTLASVALATASVSLVHAQSTLTLYGIVDAGITWVSNQRGHSAILEDTGIAQANRWGLQGAEDLGGGTKAVFTLENGFTLGNGALGQGGAMFGRTAMVGLAGRFGTLTLGRQYDFMVDNLVFNTAIARFGGVYAAHGLDVDRLAGEQVNNAVKYASPKFRGASVGAMYGFSNVAGSFGGTTGAPRFSSFGFAYDNDGPFAIGLAYTNTNGTGASVAEAALLGTAVRNVGIGARYRVGPVTVFGNYTNNRIQRGSGAPSIVASVVEAGIDTSFAVDTFAGISYIYNHYPDGQVSQLSTAIHYFLSKRTDLYASVNVAHSNSPQQPAGIFLIVNPATNVGYSTSRNQIALRVGLRSKF
ncbi:porin [Burkholderia multivorans]|uniref:porin n=1 Tax=Burkholderia multivorans TaxID=87883 RepID=UPI0020197E6B|nr:porin [Burkholderia multivorans]MCO1373989.1 porin [Burkholderia multivorans]MCO1454761.1 porin [Burkholderia multivorans]MCO1469310.1 porin [Burkholderia multivorans]UQO19124.1 porin [Burkholderia multivorans]UQO82219.1 porin [Burkholderia multivorans]